MILQIKSKKLIATDIMELQLGDRDGTPLSSFTAGAHITLQFAGTERSYSIVSNPEDLSNYKINVLRTHSGRGGSAYIHDFLQIGDRVNVKGPFNHFPVELNAEHSIFIAGGIGITPFFTMIRELEKKSKSYDLHYAARSEDRFISVDGLDGKIFRYPSEPNGKSLDISSLLNETNPETDVYVCGPVSMIRETQRYFADNDRPLNKLHFESFGSTTNAADQPIEIELELSKLKMKVNPGKSILDSLLEQGIWASYECKRGECGACAVEVIEGIPEHRDVALNDLQRKKLMCTCVSWAQSKKLKLNL